MKTHAASDGLPNTAFFSLFHIFGGSGCWSNGLNRCCFLGQVP